MEVKTVVSAQVSAEKDDAGYRVYSCPLCFNVVLATSEVFCLHHGDGIPMDEKAHDKDTGQVEWIKESR